MAMPICVYTSSIYRWFVLIFLLKWLDIDNINYLKTKKNTLMKNS